MPVPAQCQALANEISALDRERRSLQAELNRAPTQNKPALAGRIGRLGSLIGAKQPALDRCVAQNSGPPPPQPPQPLASSFTCTAFLTTSKNFQPEEPFSNSLIWGFLFNEQRTLVNLKAFPVWTMDTTGPANREAPRFSFLFGPNITTVRQTGGGIGIYEKARGTLILPLMLRFDQSRRFIRDEGSDLSIVLSTDPVGVPVAADGQVLLTGTGVFVGGWLNAAVATLVVRGTLAPIP